ncbi:MAG: hypothetical protein AAF648_08895 [Pseudomonadota bacterium]
MKTVVTTDEYTIYLKRNDRHAVRGADRAWINGDDKAAILLKHDLIKAPPQKAPEPEPEETGADAGEEAAASEDSSED